MDVSAIVEQMKNDPEFYEKIDEEIAELNLRLKVLMSLRFGPSGVKEAKKLLSPKASRGSVAAKMVEVMSGQWELVDDIARRSGLKYSQAYSVLRGNPGLFERRKLPNRPNEFRLSPVESEKPK